MLPVLTSIVLTYNNKFKQQEETFRMHLHELYDKIFAFQSQLNFLADHPGERTPVDALLQACSEALQRKPLGSALWKEGAMWDLPRVFFEKAISGKI